MAKGFTITKYDSALTWTLKHTKSVVKIGFHYNGWVAMSSNLPADGWKAPDLDDFNALATALGGTGVAGGKLKETGTTWWNSPNTGATNEVGFNGRGAGMIGTNGSHTSYLTECRFWVAEGLTSELQSLAALNYQNDDFPTNAWAHPKQGYTIRLIKLSTTLGEGETGTYTGNDGRVYGTVVIGGVEWMSENLAETKWNNGTDIPYLTPVNFANATDVAYTAANNDTGYAYDDTVYSYEFNKDKILELVEGDNVTFDISESGNTVTVEISAEEGGTGTSDKLLSWMGL
jgi:uncharacterized protein (TIGR02145 family)